MPPRRQPQRDPGVPWDAWAAPDPADQRPPAQYPPPGASWDAWAAPDPADQRPPAQYPPPGVPWDAWAAPDPADQRPPAPPRPVADLRPPAGRHPSAHHRRPPSQPRERSRWHWLLAAGVVIPLLTPLYNRVQPELLGVPFFYWCQIALTGMAAAVTLTVRLATRKRRRP